MAFVANKHGTRYIIGNDKPVSDSPEIRQHLFDYKTEAMKEFGLLSETSWEYNLQQYTRDYLIDDNVSR